MLAIAPAKKMYLAGTGATALSTTKAHLESKSAPAPTAITLETSN